MITGCLMIVFGFLASMFRLIFDLVWPFARFLIRMVGVVFAAILISLLFRL